MDPWLAVRTLWIQSTYSCVGNMRTNNTTPGYWHGKMTNRVSVFRANASLFYFLCVSFFSCGPSTVGHSYTFDRLWSSQFIATSERLLRLFCKSRQWRTKNISSGSRLLDGQFKCSKGREEKRREEKSREKERERERERERESFFY